jgi:hypothetical protein
LTDHGEVLELERAGWAALSTGGEAAVRFYREVLSEEPRFVLPGGLLLDDRDAIIRSMGGPPWDHHALHDERVVPLGAGAVAVIYRAEPNAVGSGTRR